MLIKICGITNTEDAILCTKLGTWALGFIFYPKSPRYIDPSCAAKIIEKLPKNIKTVAVVVNSSLADIIKIKKITKVTTIQLHGKETPQFCLELAKHNIEIFKAFGLTATTEISLIKNYSSCAMPLLDAPFKESFGGSGQLSNWNLAKKVQKLPGVNKIILSGGLNPDNIARAQQQINPYAYDLCSGVELKHGVKDHRKINKLFANKGKNS